MKRDWNLLREQLLAIEEGRDVFAGIPEIAQIETSLGQPDAVEQQAKATAAKEERARLLGHLELLVDAGYIEGIHLKRGGGGYFSYGASDPRLTMKGHDLLDTMRSPKVWAKIKESALSKGIELSFDAIKALGRVALDQIISG
ncbi:DUF2513 domain-containing protein [Achromobacter pulmonis]|uniref:DUF2513 domain-containing protein n=1 Tax=Achromobacter pulmonis TaxID=1389932 RepID=UPI001F25E693|nr:DUF2513 domain-containing protein [Achromobacter pulmonis]MCF7771193.1 DUF2513 domain-containing protein [Achromobacter pulmonis]